MKKDPSKKVSKKSGLKQFVATMAEESALRTTSWLIHGCNAFDSKLPKSMPMSFWTEQDVLRYAVENNIEFASVYGDIVAIDEDGNQYDPHSLLISNCKLKCTGCDRTGCIFCAFGFHSEKGETRFQRLARTHPRQYEYCMNGGQWVDNPAYDPTAPKMDGNWQNWNPKKIWVPSKQGLGMRKVFDMVNEIYGKDFYRYE
jgi:3'-phosphoadenosine 5'-phosphosulfate sulfotransferase (PAPS reductase)/FAD synthetase